jgi:hypothetical protein
MLSENPLKFVRKPKPNPSRARRLRDGEESRLLEALAVTKPRDANGCFSVKRQAKVQHWRVFSGIYV